MSAGKRREPLEGAVHLLRRPFEQPAAAHREQGVADEGDAVLVEDQRDMVERVAGHFDHPPDMLADTGPRRLRPSATSRPGIRCPRGPGHGAPVASLIARFPPVWSACQWVFHTWPMVQPRRSASASAAAPSPGSTTAVSPLASSWTSQM